MAKTARRRRDAPVHVEKLHAGDLPVSFVLNPDDSRLTRSLGILTDEDLADRARFDRIFQYDSDPPPAHVQRPTGSLEIAGANAYAVGRFVARAPVVAAGPVHGPGRDRDRRARASARHVPEHSRNALDGIRRVCKVLRSLGGAVLKHVKLDAP